MTRPLLAACAGALTAALLVVPTTAHAGSTAVDDGTGDLWNKVGYTETGEDVWAEAEAEHNVDVTRTVVKHTKKRISVTVTYDDLVEEGASHKSTYWSHFKLADGREALVAVSTPASDAAPFIAMQKTAGGKWDKTVECPGLRVAWRWDDDVLSVSLPRSCYDTPKWVRFYGKSVGAYTDPEPGEEYFWFYDNVGDAGPAYSDPADYAPWTGKIKAG